MQLIIAILILSLVGWSFAIDDASILFASEESKNAKMKEVFNEIRWFSSKNQDVWMMNQSHHGRNPGVDPWERLAIVIDKTTTPKTARYYQLSAGPLEWNENLVQKRVDYRAACFTCHNNGPRAIRPLSENADAPLSLKDRAKIAFWNLRIKTYGRIQYAPEMLELPAGFTVPFQLSDKIENDTLKVKTCIHCHKEEGFGARGTLKRQQRGTIEHLVKAGSMPPLGFSLDQKEKEELTDFLQGF